jgi:ATP-dependent exoDNAse (exonuclease V) alpha subunit
VAYRAATRVPDERTGLVFDYSRKRGVEHTEIVRPAAMSEAASWARDRVQLWNAAETAEHRKDARVAREYEVALPHELNAPQRRELVRGFARELAERHGCAVDVAIHAPHREGDARNHHAHILATTRAVTNAGLGAKTDIELKDADRTKRGLCAGKHEITAIRERWAALVNEHLAEHGHTNRIDHRSLQAQGADREPTYHKGPAVTALERRADRSFVSERTREEVTERLRAAAELGRLERESQQLARSIIDTTTQLKAVLATRDVERTRSLQDIRRDAQAAWRASRETAPPSPTRPGSNQRPLDLSGDLAAARRDAREQWLALRDPGRGPPGSVPSAGQGAERDALSLIVPDDDRAR